MASHTLDILKGALSLKPDGLMADPQEPVASGGAGTWLADAVGDWRERAGQGDAVAAAVLRELSADAASSPADDLAPDPTAGTLMARAARCIDAGDRSGAAAILAGLAAHPATAGDGFAGLAALAVLEDRTEDAPLLAGAAIEVAPGHPRANLILGYFALESSAGKAAQHHLAATSRLARRHPGFREDQRAAQQLLLLLHLS